MLVARRGLLLLLLLAPPLLWLGIVYLGSLFALLAAELLLDRRFLRPRSSASRRLKTYARAACSPPISTSSCARSRSPPIVTLLAVIVAFPIAYYAARYARGRVKALFYLAVMMPLWSSYLVKVYAWKLLLAKEGASAG